MCEWYAPGFRPTLLTTSRSHRKKSIDRRRTGLFNWRVLKEVQNLCNVASFSPAVTVAASFNICMSFIK